MKKKTRHYKTHMRFYRKAFTPKTELHFGLCMAATAERINPETFELMKPTSRDLKKLKRAGKDLVYWASDSKYGLRGRFTKLRQTIVLLMAAIHNEL